MKKLRRSILALLCEIMVDQLVDRIFAAAHPPPPPPLPPLPPPRTGGIAFLTAIREGKLDEVRKQIFIVVVL